MKPAERGAVSAVGIAVLVVLVGLGVGVYFLARGGEQEPTLEAARQEKVIRIAYANEPPYGYLDTETGRVTGEAPEIARVVMKRLGIPKVEPIVAEFNSLIPGLKAGRWDMVAAGMYITPERCREVDFSNPTYVISETLIVKQGNPLDLHSYADIAEKEDAKVGVMSGAVERGYALKTGVPEERIVTFPDYPAAMVALRKGRIDGIGCTILTGGRQLEQADATDLELADPFANPVIDGQEVKGYGAFAFRKDDDGIREAVNAELAKFIGTPEHLELVRPFGFSEKTLPGDVTAEDLCGEKQ